MEWRSKGQAAPVKDKTQLSAGRRLYVLIGVVFHPLVFYTITVIFWMKLDLPIAMKDVADWCGMWFFFTTILTLTKITTNVLDTIGKTPI